MQASAAKLRPRCGCGNLKNLDVVAKITVADGFLKPWLTDKMCMLQEREASQLDLPHARFQRTDQWIPVYSWLETLDKDEVVKSKEISDWLTENPKIQEQLCSRHSRYHLMHYIKKCHLKILKRREKKKVFFNSFVAHSMALWACPCSV